MSQGNRQPGIGRTERISDQGLQRLAEHMESGAAISDPVLAQWIRRYGQPARAIIRAHGRYHPGLEPTDG